jgi:hypothetical protein
MMLNTNAESYGCSSVRKDTVHQRHLSEESIISLQNLSMIRWCLLLKSNDGSEPFALNSMITVTDVSKMGLASCRMRYVRCIRIA